MLIIDLMPSSFINQVPPVVGNLPAMEWLRVVHQFPQFLAVLMYLVVVLQFSIRQAYEVQSYQQLAVNNPAPVGMRYIPRAHHVSANAMPYKSFREGTL